MFKDFRVATQKLKKNLNMNLNRAIIYIYRTFKFSSSSKLQMSFFLKRKLWSSKFSTTFVLKVFHVSIGNFEKIWVKLGPNPFSLPSLSTLSVLSPFSSSAPLLPPWQSKAACATWGRLRPRHDIRAPTASSRRSLGDNQTLPSSRTHAVDPEPERRSVSCHRLSRPPLLLAALLLMVFHD